MLAVGIVTAVTVRVKDQICWAALDVGYSMTTVVKTMFVIRVGEDPMFIFITGVWNGVGCGMATTSTEMSIDEITWAWVVVAYSIITVVIIALAVRAGEEPIRLSITDSSVCVAGPVTATAGCLKDQTFWALF